jgi:DNA repair exonuclease SbcCD ATPase subunit
MDPKYLLIEDFMSHRRTEIDCTKFDSALIVGKNKANPRESNGVGKSVIYHAIKYALFGKAPTSIVEKIIRDDTKEGKVTFDFELSGRIFRIKRSRTKTKARVELHEKIGDTWESADKKNQKTSTETHDEIQKLISINCNAFENSVLFSQNDLEGLASAKTPEDRRIILKNALGLEDYKKLEKLVKATVSKISKDITARQAVSESLGDPEEDIEKFSLDLIAANKTLAATERQKEELRVSLNTKRSEFSNLQRLVGSEVATTHDKLNDIKSSKKQVNTTIKTVQSGIEENSVKITSLNETMKALNKELLELTNRKTTLLNKPTKQLSKVLADLQAAQENELNGKAFIGSLNAKADELRKPIPDGEECPTCHQGLTDEYKDNYKTVAQSNLHDLVIDIADKNKKLKACSKKVLRLQGYVNDIDAVTKQLASVDNLISTKQTEIQHNQDYTDRLLKIDAQKNNDLSSALKRLSELKKLERSLKESVKLKSTDDISEKVLKVKAEVEALEEELQVVTDRIATESKNVGIFTASITARTNDLTKLIAEEERLEELEKSYNLHKKVQKSFSSSGIPTLIIHTILDDLQVEANKFLAALKPGLELQFTEDLELFFRVHGREREYQQLSGGQKMSFAFSLKIGLSVVIQRRLGVDIKFILLDEVDQSLDEATVDTYAEVIRKLQEDFKVLVITHNNRLKDKFSNAIVVEGDFINGATASLVSW